MTLMQPTLVLLLDKNNIGILLDCCGFQLWNVNPTVRKTLLCLKTWLLKANIWLKQNYKFICTSNGEGLNGVPYKSVFRLLKLRFNQFNFREISDIKTYFEMLNVLTGKNEFYEDANW